MLANKHFLLNEMRSGLGSVLYQKLLGLSGGPSPIRHLRFSLAFVCVSRSPPPKKMGQEERTVSTRLDGRSEDYKVYRTSGYEECRLTLPRDCDLSLKLFFSSPVVLEKTLESPLDCKEIKPVNHKGTQPSIFTGRTDTEAEAPILWPLDVKSWLIWKDPDSRKNWCQEEKGTTEDEMVGWHHQLNGHEFEQTPKDSEGHGSLM